MTYRKSLAMQRTLKFTLQPMSVTALAFIVFAGCSSPASQSSPESVRDPLGIDRAVNEHYFPNGVPAANAASDPTGTDTDAGDNAISSAVDDLP